MESWSSKMFSSRPFESEIMYIFHYDWQEGNIWKLHDHIAHFALDKLFFCSIQSTVYLSLN